jgi:hypothetical protein
VLLVHQDPLEIEAVMAPLELQELRVSRDRKVSRVILDQLVHKACLVRLGQPERLEVLARLAQLAFVDNPVRKGPQEQLDFSRVWTTGEIAFKEIAR